MKCSHLISKIILLYGAVVFIGVKCARLQCNSCNTLLTNKTGVNIIRSCNRSVIGCDDENYFCGIAAIHLNNIAALGYREFCVDHRVCINTTAGCSQPDCFIYCCHEKDFCNSYEKVEENLNNNLVSIIKEHAKIELPVTEQPTVERQQPTEQPKVTNKITGTKKRNVKKTTPSRASLLMSPKIVLLSLYVVILKDCI